MKIFIGLKTFEKFDLCDRNKLYIVINEPSEILNYLYNN